MRFDSDGGNFFNTPLCFNNYISQGLECTYSFLNHKTKHIDYFQFEEKIMKSLCNDVQHVDDKALEEDKILKYLEKVMNEVIFVELHHDMVVM